MLCEKEIIQKRKLEFEKPIEQYFYTDILHINKKTLSLSELISF